MKLLPFRRKSKNAPVGDVNGFLSAEERKAIGLSGSHRAAATKSSGGRLARLLGRGRQ